MSSTFQKESSPDTPPTSRLPYRKRLARFRKQGKGSWLILLPIFLLILAGGVVLILSTTSSTGVAGRIKASLNTHNFGTVKINGGLLTYRFPLAVEEGTVVIQSLGTT
jgi:hypothetical protein